MPAELDLIAALTKGFKRSPLQLNKCHESDAELIKLSENGPIIAITTDSLVEEISSGLYDNAYQVGWMTVMANVSDLAAVGAKPVGILLSQGIPSQMTEMEIEDLQKGILDATLTCGTHVLGGDTNGSTKLEMTGTALGSISEGNPMTRIGCREGDIVALTGKAGLGNLYAYEKLICQKKDLKYLPRAKVKEGQQLRSYASACMDTSDGVFQTLDELGRLNGVGFEITESLENLIIQEAKSLSIPSWILLGGIHGEFELICTIPENKWEKVNQLLPLVKLGVVTNKVGIHTSKYTFKPRTFQEAWNQSTNPREYFQKLQQMETSCQL